ncbi:MAG: type IV fimbrial bioproteinis protein FimT [bacterium]|nr:MAG: type IV fimbrial bioproteinis protein FimT [bacterium]KAF0147851.1 MAG: type IV fimbrial bioproteinis protein FimT [bacterium]KAF0167453.1 MAG: type IV fimbrial bioproteinis protein FimT [bacterium]TXT17818.1 MAG: type IV fimbrial bioproteinis protein FimT [bacterium]
MAACKRGYRVYSCVSPGGGPLRAEGMSLVEVLATLAILSILLTVAVPAFDAMITSSRFATSANLYLTSLHLARSEAIKRNGRVALCKSADGATCTANGRWDQGWIVFHDVNNNALADGGEEILRVYEVLPADLALSGNLPVANYVSYGALGASRLTSGAFQAGTLTLCRLSTGGGEARQIVISMTGRPRVQQVNVAACP